MFADNEYSVAICLPPEAEQIVAGLKDRLAQEIGWYPSRDSRAHITICHFFADGAQLERWKAYVATFCSNQKPFEIVLDHVAQFRDSNTIYLALDKSSQQLTAAMMKAFNKGAKFQDKKTTSRPHVTIGRSIQKDKMERAQALFRNESFDIRFVSKEICIRKLNHDKGQYDILKPSFPLEGKAYQLGLFGENS